MKQIIKIAFTCCLILCAFVSVSQNIIKAEYFINNDPGWGRGVNIPVNAAPDISNLTFSADISSAPLGINKLFIRSMDANGTWSVTNLHLFYKSSVAASPEVTKVEYFINIDPGFGKAINVPLTNGTDITNLTFTPDISSLPSGVHKLFIRSLDNGGAWGITNMHLFYKSGPIASPLVTQLEYFIDIDPGFGKGIQIPIALGSDVADVVFNIPSCSITDGAHNLYVRSKDNAGSWSVTNVVQFTKSGGSGFVTPSVSIATSQTNICSGTSVTFTATPTNGGTAPAYQWKVNGNNVGTNSSTFTSSGLNNNDVVTVVMTSSDPCASSTTATSNAITINVSSSVAPSVSIAASATNICSGASATFTATATNGGTSPSYQWRVNGVNAGSNSPTFTTSALNNNDVVTVVMTSSSSCATTPTATSNAITMIVTASITPSVSITASQTNICSGTSLTFTATPINGGTSPSYQWKVNGNNIGINSATFTSSALNNNDVVTVLMTSNATCATTATATSNAVTITVTSSVTPSVSIAATQTNICSGTGVTFTATPTNGGTAPSYQWKVNGNNVGSNSATFSSSTLNNNALVTVVMTSNAACATTAAATSNAITITVSASVTPSVSIAASAASICAGTSVTFTATPTNGGTSPSYQWRVNGVNAGSTSTTFTSSTLNNNDLVTVVMTSSSSCASPATATSNTITITVTAPVTPSVSITASATTICAGATVTFTATPTHGGTSPSYQWKVNGVNAGSNSPTFSSSALANNSVVTVVTTSNAACATTTSATSNALTITVNSVVTPSVSIAASATTLCTGTNVTFIATPTNGGTSPSYQWRLNGVSTGSNNSTFSTSTLNNNDAVSVTMTSNAACVSASSVNSNSITVAVNPAPVINAGPDKTVSSGDTITLHATATISSGSMSFLWSPATGLSNAAILNPVAKPNITTTFKLTATSSAGCSASDEVLITVITGLFIPHGFSPNGDGVNDVWNIRGISAYPKCIMKIYDRYGRDIFSSTGYNTPWDGKYKGNSVPVDTYYYILDLKNGSQVLSGFVTIIK